MSLINFSLTEKLHRIITKQIVTYSRNISTEANNVILENINGKGVLTLNRPSRLNTLNESMFRKIETTLLKWENEKTIVIAKSVPGKAFCAGGDLRDAYEAPKNFKKYVNMYKVHLNTNALISTYKIPYLALMNGIVMGAGFGLSVLGRYRIATENTIYASQETKVGYFPDVGTCYVLPRLCGKLGIYLALTGDRLHGVDLKITRIATNFCHSSKLPDLEKAILNANNNQELESALNFFDEANTNEFTLTPHMNKINYCFSADSVEEVIQRLEKDKSDWAKKTLERILKASPTSVKLTFKMMQLEKNMSFQQALEMEFRVIQNILRSNDLYEGIRSFLNKGYVPSWNPKSVFDLTNDDLEKYLSKRYDFEQM